MCRWGRWDPERLSAGCERTVSFIDADNSALGVAIERCPVQSVRHGSPTNVRDMEKVT